eukprot:CAMPEP_0179083468 /NCGR_PEP_ID=MMETSP0796-20121207/37694_1 /TAXON_ID=73915 /ORGANISM="Pyrodinium bahamense, Strain pbaha01" /LENGTH=76 /DNA_ID=CAMNT_0020780877 /DNA_START=13 /DNA_END=239 /DNA_ORIENTATION=-
MARLRSSVGLLVLAAGTLAAYSCIAPAFVAPRGMAQQPDLDTRAAAAACAGLAPLALEQPVGAYDSVVAMLQSWLV